MQGFKIDYLNWLFEYDRVNGKLFWKNHPHHGTRGRFKGREAGTIEPLGDNQELYRRIRINYKALMVHRVIYFLETNTWPKIVDHINGDTLDNRIQNLRVSDDRKNQSNRKTHRAGKLVGAQFRRDKGLYESRITVNKKRYFLGYFKTEMEAHLAYVRKGLELGVL